MDGIKEPTLQRSEHWVLVCGRVEVSLLLVQTPVLGVDSLKKVGSIQRGPLATARTSNSSQQV